MNIIYNTTANDIVLVAEKIFNVDKNDAQKWVDKGGVYNEARGVIIFEKWYIALSSIQVLSDTRGHIYFRLLDQDNNEVDTKSLSLGKSKCVRRILDNKAPIIEMVMDTWGYKLKRIDDFI